MPLNAPDSWLLSVFLGDPQVQSEPPSAAADRRQPPNGPTDVGTEAAIQGRSERTAEPRSGRPSM